MYRPPEAAGSSFAKQHVLLSIVKVNPWQSWRVFAEGRFRCSLPVRLKGPEVVLRSGHQRHMLQRFFSKPGEQVLDHPAVHCDVLGLGRLSKPRPEKDVITRNVRKSASQETPIPQISPPPDTPSCLPPPTRHPPHL